MRNLLLFLQVSQGFTCWSDAYDHLSTLLCVSQRRLVVCQIFRFDESYVGLHWEGDGFLSALWWKCSGVWLNGILESLLSFFSLLPERVYRSSTFCATIPDPEASVYECVTEVCRLWHLYFTSLHPHGLDKTGISILGPVSNDDSRSASVSAQLRTNPSRYPLAGPLFSPVPSMLL